MKKFLISVAAFFVLLPLMIAVGFLPGGWAVITTWVVLLIGTVGTFFGCIIYSVDAWSEFTDTLNRTTKDVVEQICRSLGIRTSSYYGNYSVSDIVSYLRENDTDHLETTLSVPKRWDYQIAVPLVRHEVKRLLRKRKKQDAFVQKKREVKVKL